MPDFTRDRYNTINRTAYDTLTNDIGKILPKFPTDKRQRCGAILVSILGSVASKVIGLVYEGISSFLHHKRHKALHKAVAVMNKKTDYNVTEYII